MPAPDRHPHVPLPTLPEHAAARFGITDSHIVTVVDCQIRNQRWVPVLEKRLRLPGNRTGRQFDLRPAHTVDCTTAGITTDGHRRPTVTIAILKVKRTPVVGRDRSAAT